MRETICLLIIFTGVVFILLAKPLRNKKIPPNSGYGLRTRATFSNPEVWYEANRISADYMSLTGWIIMLISLIAYLLPISFEWMVAITASITIVATIIMAFYSYRLANKLAQQADSLEKSKKL